MEIMHKKTKRLHEVENILEGDLGITYVIITRDGERDWLKENKVAREYTHKDGSLIELKEKKEKVVKVNKVIKKKKGKKVVKTTIVKEVTVNNLPSWHNIEKKQKLIKKYRSGVPKKIRKQVLKRDGEKCTECDSFINLEVHHIVYKSKGGKDELSNLKTLCCYCHLLKHKGESVYNIMKARLKAKGLL